MPHQRFLHLVIIIKKRLGLVSDFPAYHRWRVLIHEDGRTPIPLYVDACESSCGALTMSHAYHATFSTSVLQQGHLICHLEALNAAVALK